VKCSFTIPFDFFQSVASVEGVGAESFVRVV
jgi:hypothetical protein